MRSTWAVQHKFANMSIVTRASNLVTSIVGHVAFNPVVSATLLWVLTKGPVGLRERLIGNIGLLRDPRHFAQFVKALKWCLAFGATGVANRQLNNVALNAGRWTSEKQRWNWNEEVAVVTGGCSGIGELIVKRLIGRGIKVAVLDIQELPASLQGCKYALAARHQARQPLTSTPDAHIKFFKCDITSPSAVYSVAESVKTALGAPTILINNAGVLAAHTILSTSDEFLRKIFDVNVLSNWYTTKAFLPSMIAANKGHIVTIASTASYLGMAGLADYTASKAAILSFHETLRQELKMYHGAPNVLTTSIHPSWVRTPLLKPVENELRQRGSVMIEPEEVADKVVSKILACRGGQVFLPESAAQASILRGAPNWLQEWFRNGTARTFSRSVEGRKM
jgi:all-trans-retinol dehydrogenase (NAD+)